VRRRRWYVYPLFALLLVALLPFLALCVVFCLKLFLAALILGFVALALVSAAILLWGGMWLLAHLHAQGQERAAARRAGGPADSPRPIPLSDTSA
jgi:hypothetical protein